MGPFDADGVADDVYCDRHLVADTRRLNRERIHWICEQVEGQRILDIGCKHGTVCLLLAREGFQCTGVDGSEAAIADARALAAQEAPAVAALVEFIHAEVPGLRFEDDSFDTVVAGELLEHLSQPERLVAEAVRVLKPGGRLVVTTPYGVLIRPDHKRTFYFSSLLELMERHAETVVCELVGERGRYLCWVGAKSHPDHRQANAETARRVLDRTEEAFEERERWFLARIDEMRARLEAMRQQPEAAEAERQRAAAERRLAAERLQNASRELRQKDAQLARARRQHLALQAAVRSAQDELGNIKHARGYIMLERLRRFRREFVRGSLRTRRAYAAEVARKLVGR